MWSSIKAYLGRKFLGPRTHRSGTEAYRTAGEVVEALFREYEGLSDGSYGWVHLCRPGAPRNCIQVCGDPNGWTINIPRPPHGARDGLCGQMISSALTAFRMTEKRSFIELNGTCPRDALVKLVLLLFEALYDQPSNAELEGYVDGL
ncbi:MAG: hypothetical protein GY842_24395 [bacterium]|nr:hypothetical protein [bacterium]